MQCSLLEEREAYFLKPYAVKSRASLGRQFPEPPAKTRTCFQRDRDRIIHSKAFRRLKHKTQVFVASESDHYRSRLTHSIEVAHISRHLARLLSVNEDLCETIALAHDLGHTPFGHSGERTLNELMQSDGGFEHNRQSLRIVDELETKYPNFPGLNLSYEVREGLMKHATPWDCPYFQGKQPSVEAQVVNLGDEIAYNNHDLDDGLASHILEIDDLARRVTLWKEARQKIEKDYTQLSRSQLLYLINSHLISNQIEDVVIQSETKMREMNIHTLEDVRRCPSLLIAFSQEMQEKNQELRQYLLSNFYMDYSLHRMMKKGQLIIRKLFEAYIEDPYLLPTKYLAPEAELTMTQYKRIVCDYIAGMTDTFAEKEYENLTNNQI